MIQGIELANIILIRTSFRESRYKELNSLFNYNIFEIIN